MGISEYIAGIQWRVVRDRVLMALAIVSLLFAILEMVLYHGFQTGVFHLILGTDIAYDGGDGFGSVEPQGRSCIPVEGSKICGGAGLNASTISICVMLASGIIYTACNSVYPAAKI